VYYVRFSTAGQSNLLTIRTRRTSTFTAVMYSRYIHAARSFKSYIYFSRKKNCFPFHTNFVSALDRYAFLFYYYLFKWSAALPTSPFGHKTRELCGFVCRNSISVITGSENNIPEPLVEVCPCCGMFENQNAASNHNINIKQFKRPINRRNYTHVSSDIESFTIRPTYNQ